MNEFAKYIENEFKECNDLKHKKIRIGFKNIYVYFLETLCSGDKINDYILKSLTNKTFFYNIEKIIPSPNLIKIDNKG